MLMPAATPAAAPERASMTPVLPDQGGRCGSATPEAICTCSDGTEQEFGCIGPPTCSDACCGHDGPGPNPPGDAGTPDPGISQSLARRLASAQICKAQGFSATAETERPRKPAATARPPARTPAVATAARPSTAARLTAECASSARPVRACLAEALCQCGDGTTRRSSGASGPPTCGDACCGHDGPWADAGSGAIDAGPDAGADAGPPDAGSDAGPVLIPGDAGLESDGGECPYWPPLACDAIGICHCGDGTTQYDACAGPPTCNDACCGHDGP